jgi:hypothetical protein
MVVSSLFLKKMVTQTLQSGQRSHHLLFNYERDNFCTFSGIASTGNPEMDREVQGAARASRDQMIEIIKLWLHSGNGHDYKKYNPEFHK